jgi:hypothetical protein
MLWFNTKFLWALHCLSRGKREPRFGGVLNQNCRIKGHERKRKPGNLKADAPNKVIEYDTKHIYLLGRKLYAFCAIDPLKKDAVSHIGASLSSLNSNAAPEEVIARWQRHYRPQ